MGFGVWGLGFGVWGLGLGAWGVGLFGFGPRRFWRVSDFGSLGFRVHGRTVSVAQASGFEIIEPLPKTLDPKP